MENTWRRILLSISYDGSNYAGWQRQKNLPTIQGEIEAALEKALKIKTTLYGASRTDAGVHAKKQYAHFNVKNTIPTHKFPFILNNLLPNDIRIRKAVDISSTDHARFSALGKTYTYRILNAPFGIGLFHQYYAHSPIPIDENKIKNAIPLILGIHDFSAFSDKGSEVVSTTKIIYDINLKRDNDRIIMSFQGSSFLYHMIRIMVGTFINIGQGSMEPSNITKALKTGDRLFLGPTAPPKGLELSAVHYPWDKNLPFKPIPKSLLL